MIALNISDQHWIDQAACGSKVDDWMWHDYGKNDEPYALAESKRSCDTCPVRAECLEYALETGVSGIWSGTTEEMRRKMRRNRSRKSQAKESS